GRTRAGRCLRLYTKPDHDRRPEFDVAEVLRSDLAQTVLELRAAGVDPAAFDWFQRPPDSALAAADGLLRRLGALDDAARAVTLSARCRRMLAPPLHPRLARLVVEGEDRGVSEDAATVAALLSERDLLRASRARGMSSRGKDRHGPADVGPSDLVVRLEAL